MKKSKQVLLLILLTALYAKTYSQSYNDNINNIVQNIKSDSIEQYILHQQAYQSRFMLNQNRKEIAEYLKQKFISFGYTEARIDTFESHTVHQSGLDTITKQYNVVATLQGTNDDIIVYGAHYDSYSTDTDPLLHAPGADDNASGTAAVLETARVLHESGYKIPQTVEFVLFAAEEYMNSGFSGSQHHAEQAKNNNKNIVLMINNDMIGFNDGSNTICFSNYPECPIARNLAIFACQNYSSLRCKLWPSNWPAFADVEPFFDLSAQCVYMEESFFNPYYHTSKDSIKFIDIDYCTEVARISCASILSYQDAIVTNVEMLNSSMFNLFPNPFTNSIVIDTESAIITKSIYVTDLHGKKLMHLSNIDLNHIKLDLSSLKAGVYILSVETNVGVFTKKIIRNP